ncbi:hypothetical protein Tco_1433291 [Tanacetum coccineum]
MSTSTTHQQSLADVGSETRPLMLERGSYIPWESHFRRYLNQKRKNIKWLNKAIDEGDDLKYYEAEIKARRSTCVIYNRFAQLMNDLERNDITFPFVTVNRKFLNCLQLEWLKTKKMEKSHDPLALVAYTSSSSKTTSPYYVTHSSSVVDYDDDYQRDAF